MIGEGLWHEKVPVEVESNLLYRDMILWSAKRHAVVRKGLVEACKRDIFFYANTFVWQYNPRNVGEEVGPMIAWPFQKEAVRETLRQLLVVREDMLWEKSRELGATWWALIIADWLCLFHKRKKVLAVSHSEDAVDRPADPDSLFWKVNFMHEHLPDFITRGVRKRKLGFQYPGTSSSFNGGATTERAGVGGRGTFVLLDEFSKHRQDREIWGQTRDTGPRLAIGTHYGIGTKFYELTEEKRLKKLVMHWSQHPEKNKGLYRYDRLCNKIEVVDKAYDFGDYRFVMDGFPSGGPYPCLRSPWYDNECVHRNSRDIAMHLDIDPSGSVKQAFDPAQIKALMVEHSRAPMYEGELAYDRHSGEPYGFEQRAGGPVKLWCRLGWNEKPEWGFYGAGVDISRGTGATASCLSIGSGTLGQKVVEYRNATIDPKSFATFCVAMCRWFGEDVVLCWECQGPGEEFSRQVKDLGYGKVYLRPPSADVKGKKRGLGGNRYGWYPSPEEKDAVLADYWYALRTGRIINHSEPSLRELALFTYDTRGRLVHGNENVIDKNDMSGARINHADMVIADALMWKMLSGTRGKEVKKQALIKPGCLAERIQIYEDAKNADSW